MSLCDFGQSPQKRCILLAPRNIILASIASGKKKKENVFKRKIFGNALYSSNLESSISLLIFGLIQFEMIFFSFCFGIPSPPFFGFQTSEIIFSLLTFRLE